MRLPSPAEIPPHEIPGQPGQPCPHNGVRATRVRSICSCLSCLSRETGGEGVGTSATGRAVPANAATYRPAERARAARRKPHTEWTKPMRPDSTQIDDAVISAAIDKAVTRWLTTNNAFVALAIQSGVESTIDHWLDQRDVAKRDPMRNAVMSAVTTWLSKNRASIINAIKRDNAA
jgi:hypothetical protein